MYLHIADEGTLQESVHSKIFNFPQLVHMPYVSGTFFAEKQQPLIIYYTITCTYRCLLYKHVRQNFNVKLCYISNKFLGGLC